MYHFPLIVPIIYFVPYNFHLFIFFSNTYTSRLTYSIKMHVYMFLSHLCYFRQIQLATYIMHASFDTRRESTWAA